jgi:hypothetical protein
LSSFATRKCFCNNLALGVLKVSPAAVSSTLYTCNVTYDCTNFATKTYNGGTCAQTDVELDTARFMAVKTFSDTILSFGYSTTCFNYNEFKTNLEKVVASNAVANAGQGLGTYVGLDHIAEYFSLLSPQINCKFVTLVPAPNPGPVAFIDANGSRVTVGLNVTNRYINGDFKRNETDYLESSFEFTGCGTLGSKLIVPAVSNLFPNRITGVGSLTEMLFKVANAQTMRPPASNTLTMAQMTQYAYGNIASSMMGLRSICKQQERFCTGANQQFASYNECTSWYEKLINSPAYSPVCRTAALASGNSSTCRAKHQFMVQINPAVHCPHLGKYSPACLDTKCENPGPANAVFVAMDTKIFDAVYNQVKAQSSLHLPPANYC